MVYLSAATAAPKIVETISRYCCTPSQILTDNGTQYCNALAEHLYEIMMTDHLTIMAYSHEENSIVERANREVNKHLRAIVFDRKIKTNWSIALPLLQPVWHRHKRIVFDSSIWRVVTWEKLSLLFCSKSIYWFS